LSEKEVEMRARGVIAAFLLGVGLCFVPAFQAIAQTAEIQGWDRLTFGMSPEEVKEVYVDYENITGQKIWKETVRAERFCELISESFILSYFYPGVILSFFDNQLFEIQICESSDPWAEGYELQMKELSELVDRLTEKYGPPTTKSQSPKGHNEEWQGVKGNKIKFSMLHATTSKADGSKKYSIWYNVRYINTPLYNNYSEEVERVLGDLLIDFESF